MNRREFIRTEFVLKKAIQCLAIRPDDMVLYVGVDQDKFYELAHLMVKECHGVERDHRRAKRIAHRFRGYPNVLIQHGLLTNLPYPNGFFSKIVMHELSALISSELELRRVLDEIRRVAALNAEIFVGGIAMFREPLRGFKAKLGWTMDQWLGDRRKKWMFAAPVIAGMRSLLRDWTGSGEPGLMLSEERFLSLCEQYGLKGQAMRFELTHALSFSRTDFILRHDVDRKADVESPSDAERNHPPGARS